MSEAVQDILPDIPRIYTALAEWLACLLYILPQKKRYSAATTAALAALFFVMDAVFLTATDTVPLSWWVPCMVVAVGLMFLMIYLCCDASAVAAGYYCARAFILAEFAASFIWQLCCLLFPYGAFHLPFSALVMLPGYALVMAVMWWMQRGDETAVSGLEKKSLLSAVLMTVVVFTVSNLGFMPNSAIRGKTDVDVFYARTLVDFVGVLILTIQQRQLYEADLRRELDAADNMLHRQYEQFRQSRENIRLLNRRYHDLKMQIATIRAEQDPGKQDAYLAEMETGLRRFEAENKTGNAVVDTVLTTKSLYCTEHGINLTCIADGSLLDFMSTVEICTVVGTMLDNAIVAVVPLPEEQRLIRLAIFAQNGLVMVRVEHYCGETASEDALRPDYGVKNLRTIAEKYNGGLTSHVEQGWNYLRVLLAPARK